MTLPRNPLIRIAGGVVAVLLFAAVLVFSRGPDMRDVSAVFPRTVSLFEGSDVRIMGIRVGTVTALTPLGTSVRVDMSYDAKYDLPADAKAVIVSPSVIADRFVQLTPAYDGGPRMADGALIAQADTAVPVELDRTFEATQQLMTALGPEGANSDGAVSELLDVMALTLGGQGSALRGAIKGAADVTDRLGNSSDDISGTITHLGSLSTQLATYDADVEELNTHLGSVSASLASNQDNISDLLRSLAGSLGEVEGFVRDNRAALAKNVSSLSKVTAALDGERVALTQIVDIAPLAFTDLVNTYDPRTQAVRTRANFAELIRRADQSICNAAQGSADGSLDAACDLLAAIVTSLPIKDGFDIDSAMPTVPAPGSSVIGSEQLPELRRGLSGILGTDR